MHIQWQGQSYPFDQGAIKMSQAKVIKQFTGLGLVSWEKSLEEADPDALVALVWVALDQNDIKTDITSLDFTMDDLATLVVVDPAPVTDAEVPTVAAPDPAPPAS